MRRFHLLEHTFIHLSGMTQKAERELWDSGIRTWHDYLDRFGGSAEHKHHCTRVASSKYALKRQDPDFFAETLPINERWRAFKDFSEGGRVAYLDIETTGLGTDDHTTVIGVYDGLRVSSFVYGRNMEEFLDHICGYQMIVTFNGARFDLPFIRRELAGKGLVLPQLHIDLMYVMRSLNMWGGLKVLEQRFGMEREDELKGLTGYDAVKLWQRYRKDGDESALELLVRYNAADISNLKPLMEWAYNEKRKLCGIDAACACAAGLESGNKAKTSKSKG